ncbi:DUF2238 domain-containing protein [Blastococcus sp. VKM Ac-2987]|uniref:DUF2238 domain-containing protein n=1 Tax=Blastococcus sp. VKM Ac-2987 TaxID=3004141 RepID=UPI0022ABA6B1|nr:DUF2238 domain-containing protein [Blastococcus sp. VKM Ac-2987]MCZ2858927.1 DUF2238 domain-containing protein [Blastococcus sp. VKM Ac-2987]
MDRLRTAVREQFAPVGVLVTGTAGLLALGTATGQANRPVYALVVLGGAVAVARLHLRVGLSTATIWGLVAFALGHLAGGMVPVGDGILYQVWLVDGVLRYDNLQHLGFGFVGRAIWEALRHRLAPSGPDLPGVTRWIVVLGATAAGAVNEIVEYVLTLVLPEHSVGGYDNTARDLVADLVGGLAVGWWTGRRARAATRL